MAKQWIVGLLSLMLVGSAAAQTEQARDARPPVWSRLERFSSEADFAQYVRALRRAQHGTRFGRRSDIQYAQAETTLCPDGRLPPCRPQTGDEEEVVVTGTIMRNNANSVSPAVTAITNVQTLGVDEGDVVKQIGQYLIVLQDGRLFVADTRPGGRPGLALTSRINVYRKSSTDTWYDEMLVTPQRVLVTGYNYDLGASEYNVFTFHDGRLTREATYYISSDDYYSVDNYASRLVNGRLVLYTPISLYDIDVDETPKWPIIRRWLREDARGDVLSAGRQMFDARNIYRPISPILDPTIHSVTVCPLGAPRAGDELECESQGFVAGGDEQFFVSGSDVYLWTAASWREQSGDYSNECKDDRDRQPPAAAVFRVPLRGGDAPTALLAQGAPANQFGMAASDTEFRALLTWNSDYCPDDQTNAEVRYFHAPLSAFQDQPRAARDYNYVRAPSPASGAYEARFTENYLVYGGHARWSYGVPDAAESRSAAIVALPLAAPDRPTVLHANHDALRVDRVGDNAVITGYGNDSGLSVSMLQLTHGAPHMGDTLVLKDRYESEGRSHAFNSSVDENNEGLMGVPTVTRTQQANRYWFYSQASDVSFFAVDGDGRINSLGPLLAGATRDDSYQCEVSCIDWYGNSRPVFTDGRIFALSETEIIEGTVQGGAIHETRRVNLTAPPPAS